MDQRRREEEMAYPQKGKRQSQKSSLVPTFLYSSFISFLFIYLFFFSFLELHLFLEQNGKLFGPTS